MPTGIISGSNLESFNESNAFCTSSSVQVPISMFPFNALIVSMNTINSSRNLMFCEFVCIANIESKSRVLIDSPKK